MGTPSLKELKVVKGHFRGDAKYGATTKLVEKATGRVLFEGMGAGWTKMELLSGYVNQEATKARLAG
jgi:hypothetical protein